ncbi:uncharacterized protein B0T15DRAFT_558929 [Chaetomium strumarium]|uniref:GATA-type domain-containing protein n=1 Tax=Chaetomium strumarium TaxID=1170767 RepID=A0AAJ0M0V3_9PEZI|nr:hypothetical protein B0T15DRAFT_558929 [Chaetomium strumarium]
MNKGLSRCGLFLKLHGVVRPLSLKTDVIKKRNRGSGAGLPVGGTGTYDTTAEQYCLENVPRAFPAPRRIGSTSWSMASSVAGTGARRRSVPSWATWPVRTGSRRSICFVVIISRTDLGVDLSAMRTGLNWRQVEDMSSDWDTDKDSG